jgi:hypothetical protein
MQAGSDRNEELEVDRPTADAAMERYAAGDKTAFSDVYDALAPALFDRLLAWTEDPALAEEMTKTTLLGLHRARGRFIRGTNVTAWAFAIADRVVAEHALGHAVAAPSMLARARRAFGAVRAVIAIRSRE